jgi:predicted SAM-dependent methyltransferase
MSECNKEKIKQLISQKNIVIIELGPGLSKKYEDAIDIVDLPGVDIVADVQKGLDFIPESSVDKIYSSHFMEHIDNLESTMMEFQRVLKPGGELLTIVPHFSNPHFYSDYTHKNFWGIYTPFYFSKKSFYKRAVPSFCNKIDFEVKDIKLVFYSPFIGRKVFKRFFQLIFNSSRYMQELYEENFVYLIPTYEMEIRMEKRK